MGKKGYRSIYGDAQRTCYIYIEKLENYYNKKFKTLIVDCGDGQHVLPFLRKGHMVDCYEKNDIFLNGGKIDKFEITGLKKIIEYLKFNNLVSVNEKNYYESKVEKNYDFVYVYRSLHLDSNNHISKDIKMRRLLSSVKENGYIYILYHLAENEYDYVNFPKNQYFRSHEMTKYFDKSWDIINMRERDKSTIHKCHPFHTIDHSHRVGYVFAKKKYKKRKYKYNLNIKIID